MRTLILFILIFGPKTGWFDTRLLLIVLPFILRRWFIDKTLFLIFSLFLVYSFSIDLLNVNRIESTEYLQYARVLLDIILVPWIVRTFRINLKHVILVLGVHLSVVLLTLISVDIKNVIDGLIGFNKSLKPLRRNGLTMGYDMSGYLLIVLFLLASQLNRKRLLSGLSLLGVIFTSRVSILLSIIIILIKNILSHFYIVLAIVGFLFLILYEELIEIYSLAIVVIGLKESPLESYGGYAIYSLNSLSEQIFIWPKTTREWMFGFEKRIVDSGWSMLLQNVGSLGVFLLLMMYRHIAKITHHQKVFVFILLVTFILNFKNAYLLTRNSFELILVLAFIFKYDNSFTEVRRIWG